MLLKQLNFILMACLFLNAQVFAQSTGNLVGIPNPDYSLSKQAQRLTPLNANSMIHFKVWLKLRNQQELRQLVREIYSPQSPQYQKFLTPTQITERFLSTSEIKKQVQTYFITHGMQAKIKNQVIEVTGSVSQIAEVLHVKMFNYRYKKKTVYANANAPIIDAEVAKYISGITGLSNIPRFHPGAIPAYPRQNKLLKSRSLHFIWDSFFPSVLPTTQSLNGFTGAQLRTTYKVDNMSFNGVALNGQGQTIIIVDSCGSLSPSQIISDANQYSASNGLPLLSLNNNLALINANESSYVQCGDTSWDGEIALDLESAHTLAPAANIVMVFSNGNNDLDNAEATVITTLLANNFSLAGFSNAQIISNSWAGQEAPGDPLEASLALGSAAGLSVNFSSGDCGDNITGTHPGCTGTLSVNYPSSSTYVSAIGGSSLFVDDSWNYAFETGWGDHLSSSREVTGDFDSGSGGGISQYYGPAIWQSPIYNFEAGGYGVISAYGACPNCRALPDIAMLGDPQTGLKIIVNNSTAQMGGTSLACPLFSATLSVINQKRAILNKGRLGQAAPYLYANQIQLATARAVNLIIPPHKIIAGAFKPANVSAPISSFTIKQGSIYTTFSWDSSLTIVEDQFWNDVVGVGSPEVPRFIDTMSAF